MAETPRESLEEYLARMMPRIEEMQRVTVYGQFQPSKPMDGQTRRVLAYAEKATRKAYESLIHCDSRFSELQHVELARRARLAAQGALEIDRFVRSGDGTLLWRMFTEPHEEE